MKSPLFSLVLLLGLCFGAAFPSAYGLEKPPLPSGPVLRKMGDFTAFRITYSYGADKQKPKGGEEELTGLERPNDLLPAAPRTVIIRRTRPLWEAVTVDVKGHTLLQCSDGELQFVHSYGMRVPMLAPYEASGEMMYNLVDFNRVDFPDMEWVSEKTYLGVESLGELECMVFVRQAPEGNTVAWINKETRFPILWKRGTETRVFQQLPKLTERIVFPAAVAKMAATMKEDRDRLLRRPPPGG